MKSKYKKIIVLGSNSFTGSNYINETLSSKNKIIGISRSKELNDCMLPYKKNQNLDNFKFFNLNLNLRIEKFFDIVDEFKPDLIVNFIAQGEVRNSWLHPLDWYQTNCNLIVKLTTGLLGNKFLKKYISISTPEVYGSNQKRIKESNIFNPSTPYAASKLAGDLHLITIFKKYGFPVVFTRSSNVYGPGQQLYRIIPKTIISIINQNKLELHGKGKSERSFIFIKDVCNAINIVANNGELGDVYHISNNELYTIKYIVEYICKKMRTNFSDNVKLVSENFGQDDVYKLNSTKIRNNLNWSDKTSMSLGIDQTIKWINNNWNIISKMSHNYIHKV